MGKLYLILENGTVFEGNSFGADAGNTGGTVGELVFTTGMAGYIETVTDPSYYGQIVVQTFPLIGNYGIISSDMEIPVPKLKAYIVREWCEEPSNFRSEGNLSTFLLTAGVVGLCGIDTRALTRIIREQGTMNAVISKTPEFDFDALKNYRIENSVAEMTCKTRETFPSGKDGAYKVALYDFGARHDMISELSKRGCDVTVFPANTKAAEITEFAPDGVILSDGPGDPAENTDIIAEISILSDKKIPVFGISLGHQILALSGGAKTLKLKYGHRGANQPVMDIKTGKTHITGQNHGYAVSAENLPKNIEILYINLNDKTCEGIEFTDRPAYSVQFRPETAAGPNDTGFLYDKFEEHMKKARNN